MSVIKCRIEIRETATGDVVDISARDPRDNVFNEWRDGDDGNSEFVWKEHNFSCDCNRRLFFTDHECEDDPPCGDHAYRVRITRQDNGSILYSEWEGV